MMVWRVAALLAVTLVPATAAAQSINRERVRYEIRQAECEEAYRAAVARAGDDRGRSAAAARRERCKAAAERRFTNALRVQLRPPE